MNGSATSQQKVDTEKHFTTSILLWVRTDQSRQTGMDYWKGPHSKIISATPGLEEYRQLHLAEQNPGRWPTTDGIETQIPSDRKIDGIAEVTFQSALSPFAGRSQTQLAYKDEINVFRRTLLYAGPPRSSRWYDVAPGEKPGSRAVLYLRRRPGASGFRNTIRKKLIPALIDSGTLKELRAQIFLPWNEKMWDTPHVAHDNPKDQHFHASVILGFSDDIVRGDFFTGGNVATYSQVLAPVASAIHAYDIAAALTYVRDGEVLPHFEP
ncbi:strictosidine synthase [Nocardia sp. NPDC127606]|uniref:strictosidine synthase n=1 Tax=Nocardia sp. NPDC127606 TaxID=3345406 RepID=UPI00363666AE